MARQRSAQAERPIPVGDLWRLASWAGVLAMAFIPGRTAAQGGNAGTFQPEPKGFEFPAGSGWQRPAAQVRALRGQLLQSGALSRLNGSGAPAVSGRLRVAVVPVLFQGNSAPYPIQDYQELLFSTTPGPLRNSASSYYLQQSRGALILEGKVFDWVQLPQTESYYTDGCNGIGVKAACPTRPRPRMLDFLEDALSALSNGPNASTVWQGFDNEGPDGIADSGDDDGVIDLVIFLHPSVDGACGGNGLWSHRFGLASWGSGGGNGYETRTLRRGVGGQPIPGQFMTINAYTLQSALGGSDACTATSIMPIGTVAHETGHVFGLPDLYDTDPLSGTNGIGEWGLMGAGNYARPYSPSSLDAWSLTQLGWVTVDTLRSGFARSVGPVQRSDTVYFAKTAEAGFSMLIENRQAVNTDTAMMNPTFTRAKAPGLLIWLIDEERVQSGWISNRINTGTRQGITLVQADGFNQLGLAGPGRNRGDRGDPFPGQTGNVDFGLATIPAAINWAGTSLNVRVDQIATLADGAMHLRFTQRSPTLVASQSPGVRIRLNDHIATRVSEVIGAGEPFQISVDSMQLTFDGRSAARFLAWNDGGARFRTITARSGAPDTLLASFAILHRLRVSVTGPGSVHSTVGSVTGEGIFLNLGDATAVTAVPQPGAEFLGWRGDTTAFTTVLPLSVTRPIDLIAVFAPKVTLDPVVVLRAVLGGAKLDVSAERYLDAVGNQNGIFDVGDYLAWIRRNGLLVPSLPRGGGNQ